METLVLWRNYNTFIEVHGDNELNMILNNVIAIVKALTAITFLLPLIGGRVEKPLRGQSKSKSGN